MRTNWSSPKTNIFAGMNDLRKCLASGYNARLIKIRNEDCKCPIRVKDPDKDFRHYSSYIGCGSSVNKINANPSLNEFEKYLSLNYISVFGSKEAKERYYNTGEYGADNFKNMGCSHLVKVDDYIKFLEDSKDYQRANMYKRQYRAPEHADDVCYFFSFFKYDAGCPYSIKKFKHKVWVVVLYYNYPKIKTLFLVHVLNVLAYPLKYIPTKSVLRMPEYKCVTYRIGDVTNGFAIEFYIPKKFGFK